MILSFHTPVPMDSLERKDKQMVHGSLFRERNGAEKNGQLLNTVKSVAILKQVYRKFWIPHLKLLKNIE